MSEVFISYSRADSQFVDGLIRDLEQNGVPVWLDRHDIEGGTAWRAAISEAVRRCRAFVIVLSPNSTGSKNVSRELSLAESHDRMIVPIIYQDCDIPPGMEYQLAELQWINLNNMTYEEGLRRLVKVLTKGAETASVAPDQSVEKRRSDTARLRQILGSSTESSPVGLEPPGAAQPHASSAIPDAAARAEAKPARSMLMPVALACAVLLGIGAYAFYRNSSSSGTAATEAHGQPSPTAPPAATSNATPDGAAADPRPTTPPDATGASNQSAAQPQPTKQVKKPTPEPAPVANLPVVGNTRLNLYNAAEAEKAGYKRASNCP